MNSLAQLRGCADAHLARYLDPDHPLPRAFAAYDRAGDSAPDHVTALDVLAPVLLSVRISYAEVVPMFASTGPHRELRDALDAVLGDQGCRTADFLEVNLSTDVGPWALVLAAFRAAYPVPRIKTVTVSNILHRKRPRLVPIYDRWVRRFYLGAPSQRHDAHEAFWPALQADLRAHVDWLSDTVDRHQSAAEGALTPLRAADIIIWEHQVAPGEQCRASSTE